MKKPILSLVLILGMGLGSIAFGQNIVFETIYLKPNLAHSKELRDNIKSHNTKFHAKAPYQAGVWQVISGQRSGNILWVMGPFTFADLDKRPSAGGHDDDWAGKVMPLVNGMNGGSYWNMMTDYSYQPSENYQGKVMRIRTIDIKRGKWDEFQHMMSLITKVYQEKKIGHSLTLFDNWANDGEADAAIVWQYDNYAYWDKDIEFSKLYEEVHGDNSWHQFNEAIMEIVESSSDELLERVPN